LLPYKVRSNIHRKHPPWRAVNVRVPD